ncbi:MAG: acyltransferase [Microbacteriaceae bacterium]|nr:MAG: acyltransferase [Microbacteriaceae bacterium]
MREERSADRQTVSRSHSSGPTLAARIGQNIGMIARDAIVNSFMNSGVLPRLVRPRLWSMVGHSIDRSATINPSCYLGAVRGLTVGARSFINYGCFFDLAAETTIGSDCSIGYRVMFVTASHDPGDAHRRAGAATSAPIAVGDGTWLGARVVVLPGVTIGPGCVIAAGSVVVADCEPNALYAGSPAKWKRDLAPGTHGS